MLWATSSPSVMDKEVSTAIKPEPMTQPTPKSHLYRPTSWDHSWYQFFINLCPVKRQKPHSNVNRVAYDKELLNNGRLVTIKRCRSVLEPRESAPASGSDLTDPLRGREACWVAQARASQQSPDKRETTLQGVSERRLLGRHVETVEACGVCGGHIKKVVGNNRGAK